MLASEYKNEFLKAEEIELNNLQEQNTIQFVTEMKNQHKLRTRFVYDIKTNANGDITRSKVYVIKLEKKDLKSALLKKLRST